ncbi:uncharacterized protein PAC_18043 [Phialocephala subalpina]|uniref:Uncharacterized protein n=1 Tax=Phialocephala subalpina TaxID=576137 RepID=A0A1L7XSY3_9HELO|nr:uncharacterized protein PAC_18043 [Phialocephala subalpina]
MTPPSRDHTMSTPQVPTDLSDTDIPANGESIIRNYRNSYHGRQLEVTVRTALDTKLPASSDSDSVPEITALLAVGDNSKSSSGTTMDIEPATENKQQQTTGTTSKLSRSASKLAKAESCQRKITLLFGNVGKAKQPLQSGVEPEGNGKAPTPDQPQPSRPAEASSKPPPSAPAPTPLEFQKDVDFDDFVSFDDPINLEAIMRDIYF